MEENESIFINEQTNSILEEELRRKNDLAIRLKEEWRIEREKKDILAMDALKRRKEKWGIKKKRKEESIRNVVGEKIGDRKITNSGYVNIKTKHGWVPEHRLKMEQHLGRKIAKGEVVHHRDGDKASNEIENLQLMCKSTHSIGIETIHSEDIYRLILKIKELELNIRALNDKSVRK